MRDTIAKFLATKSKAIAAALATLITQAVLRFGFKVDDVVINLVVTTLVALLGTYFAPKNAEPTDG